MDLPTRSDGALSQPTRARLFGLLTRLRRPAGTDELAELISLHPNGVRAHLERLREAGLVERERVRQIRGRPRDMWIVAAEPQFDGEPPTGYNELARWLARAISPGGASLAALEAAGRTIGSELAPQPGCECTSEARLHAALAALGFQPRREPSLPGTVSYRLRSCPYRDAVRESPEVVCTLHRGITLGLLDSIAPATELSEFTPEDPDLGGCRIELRGGLAEPDGA